MDGTLTLAPNGANGRKRGPGRCRSCGAEVFWCTTVRGKHVPFNVNPEPIETRQDGAEVVRDDELHWNTCERRDEARRVAPVAASHRTPDFSADEE